MVFFDLIEVPTPNNEITPCMQKKYPIKYSIMLVPGCTLLVARRYRRMFSRL